MTAPSCDVRVKSIPEYIGHVLSIAGKWDDTDNYTEPWFRGIGDFRQHKLLPRLYREPGIDYLAEEAKMRVAFATRALPFVDSTYRRRPWEWYFLMQHYGTPTRLLDWTESAMVALHFAFDARPNGQSALPAVWVLNPFELNKITINQDKLMLPVQDGLESHLPKLDTEQAVRFSGKLPVAVHPEYIDRRMLAQQSKFTVHGSISKPLEEIPELLLLQTRSFLVRIIFETNDEGSEDVKRSLAMLGTLNSTVFPDLTGLSKDIRRDYTPTQE